MPLQLAKPEHAIATQHRIDAATQALADAFRSLTPAVQRAGEEMGRALRDIPVRRRP